MHCEHCGAELGPKARYCGACGTPVAAAAPRERVARGDRLRSLVGRTRRERALTAAVAVALVVAVVSFLVLDPADDGPTPAQRAADARCLQLKAEVAELASAPGEDYAGRLVASAQAARGDISQQLGAGPVDDALRDLVIELGALGRVLRAGSASERGRQAERVDTATARLETALGEEGLERCDRAAIVPAAPAP